MQQAARNSRHADKLGRKFFCCVTTRRSIQVSSPAQSVSVTQTDLISIGIFAAVLLLQVWLLPCEPWNAADVSGVEMLPASGAPPANTLRPDNNADCQRVG